MKGIFREDIRDIRYLEFSCERISRDGKGCKMELGALMYKL